MQNIQVIQQVQTELQDVKAEITKVNGKIEVLEEKRNNAEESLRNSTIGSPEYNFHLRMFDSADAEITRLCQKESDLRQMELMLINDKRRRLEVCFI